MIALTFLIEISVLLWDYKCHLTFTLPYAKGHGNLTNGNCIDGSCCVDGHTDSSSGVRRKFSWGGFIQWDRVVICICCALFVTSQFDVIVLFPNQRFSEVRWHNMHVFLYIHSPYFMCHCTEYNLLALQVRLSEENTPYATIHSS